MYKMGEYSAEEGSGLELVHVSDVLDYLGSFNDTFLFLALTQICFAGVSEPQARAIVRYNLLHPRKPVLSLKDASVIDDNQEEIFHIYLGAAAVALLFLFLALTVVLLYYKKRWVNS